jgi:thymidylate kinase
MKKQEMKELILKHEGNLAACVREVGGTYGRFYQLLPKDLVTLAAELRVAAEQRDRNQFKVTLEEIESFHANRPRQNVTLRVDMQLKQDLHRIAKERGTTARTIFHDAMLFRYPELRENGPKQPMSRTQIEREIRKVCGDTSKLSAHAKESLQAHDGIDHFVRYIKSSKAAK